MKKVMGFMLALLLASSGKAAITFNTSVDEGATPSFSFNALGTSHTMLVVGVFSTGAGSTLTAASFNGSSMTQRVMTSSGVNGRSEIWTLAAPASGSHTLSVTFSGTTPTAYRVVVASYDGVNSTNAVNANHTLVSGGVMSLSGTATAGNWSVFLVNTLVGGNGIQDDGTGIYVQRRFGLNLGTTFSWGDEAADASGERFGCGCTDTFTGTTVEMVQFVATPTPTFTVSPTPTWTPTVTKTATPTVTQTNTPAVSPTFTPTVTKTVTLTVTKTPTPTPTLSASPTLTMTPAVFPIDENISEKKGVSNQTGQAIRQWMLVDPNGVPYTKANPFPVWNITPTP